MAKVVEDGMSIINKHIESGEFSNIYLFTGDQRYIIEQYVKKLSDALTDTSENSMNYMKLNKDGIKYTEIADFALDMPFFADRKVVEVWNSDFFKKGNEGMESILHELPETTVLIFVEENIDERIKIFSTVKKLGTVVNMSTPSEKTLLVWIKGLFTKEGYRIDDAACYALLAAVGTDMNRLMTEIDKLKSYCIEQMYVSAADVDRLCVSMLEGKIFDMMDALSRGDKKNTIRLYDDLLALKEPPMRILALITRQFNGLLNTRIVMDESGDSGKIAKLAKIQPFLVKKYKAQCEHYTTEQLMDKLVLCQQCEMDIKTGRVRDTRAIELLVFNLLK